jgi:hypothetical protein
MKDGTVGLYLFTDSDRLGVERLGASADAIAQMIRDRDDGLGYSFAIRDRAEVVGYYFIHGIGVADARGLGGWVGPAHRGQGYGTFGLGMVLQFAFQNLRLDRVFADSAPLPDDRAAWLRVLAKHRFDASSEPPSLNREGWRAARERPALAALHSGLRAILESELAAGNEIAEVGDGWPDQDSVFIRLRNPFQPREGSLPAGVEFLAVDDPHWWVAEYHSQSPRHLLVY